MNSCRDTRNVRDRQIETDKGKRNRKRGIEEEMWDGKLEGREMKIFEEEGKGLRWRRKGRNS